MARIKVRMKPDPDEILSALEQKDGIVCVITADLCRHYVRGYDMRRPYLSKCAEILRSDERGDIYEDINGGDCLHKHYYAFCRHPALGGPYIIDENGQERPI